MKDKYLKELISRAYNTAGAVQVDYWHYSEINSDEAEKKYSELVGYFHMTSAVVLTEQDEYFCDIRADHFLVEFGYTENLDWDQPCILITANHKGIRRSILFTVSDCILIDYFNSIDKCDSEETAKEGVLP